MIKALVVTLSITLGAGVAFAQAKKAPARKRPPKAQPAEKKPEPKTTPDPVSAATPATPAGQLNPLPPGPPAGVKPTTSPATAPGAKAPAPAPAGKAPTAGKTPTPLRTDEKAGTKLEKGHIGDTDVSPEEMQKATQAFLDGNEHLNKGLWLQSAQRYREALAHWDHPAIHYNLALALINLDQPIEVYEELNKAIVYGEEPLEKDKFDHAKDYLKLVEGQLADIEVSCDKPGAKVSVDGKEVFVAPGKYAAKARVGKHTFFADKEGYPARVTAPFIGPGEKFGIHLNVYTQLELTRYNRKWQRTWVPYVVMGGAAVVGLAAGALQLSAQSDYDSYNAEALKCPPTDPCRTTDPKLADLSDSADSKRMFGNIGYGVAGAALATGVVLWWVNRPRSYLITPEQYEAELAKKQAAVGIAPIVTPEVKGAAVQGKF